MGGVLGEGAGREWNGMERGWGRGSRKRRIHERKQNSIVVVVVVVVVESRGSRPGLPVPATVAVVRTVSVDVKRH